MADAQIRTLFTADLRLSCHVWPGPPDALPLVLLHGLTGSAADWSAIAPWWACRRTVYAWDARGHGASEWSPDAAYAGDAHFADVVGALDSLGIERCALAGFSMGGSVAILCAGALPDRISHLIVVDSYPHPEMSPGSRAIAERLASLDGGGPDLGYDPAIARSFAEMLSQDDPRRLDLWPFWEAGAQPALIVRGALSTVLTESMAAEMLVRRPSARLITLRGVGHVIPSGLSTELESFLTEDAPSHED